MTVGAADERAHEPGASSGWWETWHLDAATDDGTGLSVRLACAPALGVAWWWTYLVLPHLSGPVVVRDHEVTLPRQGLEIRADGLWGELTCETAFEHWSYGLEAFGVRLDEPADALRGEIGERIAVGLDIEWEISGNGRAPHEHASGWPVTGYSQIGAVRGEVLLGRSRIELDAIGQRTHTWGVPPFDVSGVSAWMHAPDLEVSFTRVGDDRIDGYVVVANESPRSISTLLAEVERAPDGSPAAARFVVDHELELDVEVLGWAPVPIVGPRGEPSVIHRVLCRFDRGGDDLSGEARAGNGWATWLDPG